MIMEGDNLALELLRQVKADSRKWFIAFLTTLVMFFASNVIWLYVWNLPSEDTSSEETYSVEQDSEGDGNINYIGESGDITNGTSSN